MCYGRSTYGDVQRPRADPSRTPDHGYSLSPWPGDGGRSDERVVRRAQLFDGPHPASRARGEGRGAARRRRASLRVLTSRTAADCAQVGAAPSRRHVLRRFDRASRRRAARERREAVRRRTGADRGDRGEGEEGEQAMNSLAELVLKVSLILSAALAIAMALRARSAALRHWVLSVGIVCAATTPALVEIAPAWGVPFALTRDSRSQPAVRVVDAADGVVGEPVAVGEPSPIPVSANAVERISMLQVLAWVWMAGSAAGCLALIV